jgi:hypothetical protein
VNIAIGSGRRLRATFVAFLTVSLMATLVVAETASARTLSERLATRTAAKLVRQQLADRERDLVEARISEGDRINRNVFRFLYDDLNREGEVCTAVIDVRLVPAGGNTVRARFLRGSNCERPGVESLAVRTASRAAARRYLRATPAVVRSVRRYVRDIEACERLDVPSDRQDEATLLLGAGLIQATVSPLAPTIDSFANTLQSLGLTEDQLIKGAAAWRDFLDGARSLPTLSPNACAVLAEWAANGYTDATAPVDFAALRTLTDRLQADGREVRRTARYLTQKGIDPLTAVEFTLEDLIGTTVVPDGDTGERAARILAR